MNALYDDSNLQKLAENALKKVAKDLKNYPAQYAKMVVALTAWQASTPQVIFYKWFLKILDCNCWSKK